MSNLSQMLGLAVHNFTSAAVGMAVMAALIRGLARRRASTLGNFWVDLTRTMTRILVPIAFVFALFFVSQGVIQNFHGNRTVTTVEGTEQVIPGGPAASQIAIKQLGTNGGGFFNMNSAHPFENSGPFNNFVEMYAIAIIPFALRVHLRPDGRRQAAGPRRVRDHARHLGRHVARARWRFEGNGNPRLDDVGAEPGGHRRRSPAGTWKARRSASDRRHRAVGRRRPPGRRTVPSTRCTTATRRSAAWSRCRT